MSLIIRRPQPAEADELSALVLRSKAHWGYDEAFIEACRDDLRVTADSLRQPGAWVSTDGDRLTGYCLVNGAPPEGELSMLFVDPKAIGTGTGRRLLEHAVSDAAARGFRSLGIDADPGAEGFYRRMGAIRVGASPSSVFPGRQLPRLRLDL